jgi:hypothetical protein
MAVQSRKTVFCLLLALILSHAALILHASEHVAAEQQGCQICAQYSNLTNALPPATTTVALPPGYVPEPLIETRSLRAHAAAPCRQRAPPQVA